MAAPREQRPIATTEDTIKRDLYDARDVGPLDTLAAQLADLRAKIVALEARVAVLEGSR